MRRRRSAPNAKPGRQLRSPPADLAARLCPERRGQEQARLRPVALHGALGDAANRGDFREGEAAKEGEVDELGERRLEAGEIRQSVAQPLHFLGRAHGRHHRLYDRDERHVAATLLRVPRADRVDDEPAHGTRGVAEEPVLVGELEPFPARETEVGLVQERRRVPGHRPPGARDVGVGEPVQLVIEQGEERLARLGVAALGAFEDPLQRGRRFPAHPAPC